MDKQFSNQKYFNEFDDKSDSVQNNVEVILQDLYMLDDVSKRVESIKQKLDEFSVYCFDEAASQQLEFLKNSFNLFQFEILFLEQQYCNANEDILFDFNSTIARIYIKIKDFEIGIKVFETYLYRNGLMGGANNYSVNDLLEPLK